MAIILNPQSLRRYVLERDRQKSNDDVTKTVWLLKVPTGKVADEIWMSTVTDAVEKDALSETSVGMLLRCADLGLAGWEKLADEEGSPITYTDAMAKAIPTDIKVEIGTEIFRLITVGASEAKN